MGAVIDLEKEQDVMLNALVTVVNAKKASKQMKAFGEFFNNQIEFATTIVLSRTQNTTAEQLELCVKQMQKLNQKAAVVTTPWDEISGEQLLKVIEGQDSLEAKVLAEEAHEKDAKEHGHHGHEHEEHEHHGHEHGEHGRHHHHHADEVFTSWGMETPHKFSKAEIETALEAFAKGNSYGEILRAKGMVENKDGGWIYFDMTPGEYEIREGDPDYTGRLCVIGTNIEESKLKELFGIG